MKIISIQIKDEEAVIKWESKSKARWSVSSARLLGARFADSIKSLSTVAAKSVSHADDMMAVRSIVVSEDKKGISFVKLSGVLAATVNNPFAKPGKFTTPKIEITLFANEEMKEVEEAAKQYARGECGAEVE